MQWSPHAESVYKFYRRVCMFAYPTLLQTLVIMAHMALGAIDGVRGRGDQGGMGIRACKGILASRGGIGTKRAASRY
jgi:hypothetical protein